jgi:hypothetical protein
MRHMGDEQLQVAAYQVEDWIGHAGNLTRLSGVEQPGLSASHLANR